MKCSICQSEMPGAYCPACGAPGGDARCKNCETTLVAGANYCTGCGEPIRTAPSNLPWIVAGAALVALIVVLLVPGARPGGDRMAGFGTAPALQPTGGPTGADQGVAGRAPALKGTPREQADRLFNRVMQAQAQGDTAQFRFFLPMAVQAYRQAGELDADGLYHLSVLETAFGDPAAARATAERILAGAPDHLLGLAAAAIAADAEGHRDAARRYYGRFLSVFDAEQGKGRPEYVDHAGTLPGYREDAEAYLQR